MGDRLRRDVVDAWEEIEDRNAANGVGGAVGLAACVGTFLAVREWWTTDLMVVVPACIGSLFFFGLLATKFWRIIHALFCLSVIVGLIVYFSLL